MHEKPPLRPLAAVALAAVAGASLALPHDPTDCDSISGALAATSVQGTALNEPTREHYLSFFGEVAGACALDICSELLDATKQLNLNQYTQAEVDALYAKLALRLPVLRMSWDGSSLQAVSLPVLPMTLGLERGILVEIVNTTGSAKRIRAWFENQPKPRTGFSPSGGMNPLLARLQVDDLRTKQAMLTVRVGSQLTLVPVPITLQRPAVLVGTAIDSDLGTPFPGRVRVTGSDGLIRQSQEVGSNSTLFMKRILGVAGRSFRLPFTYTDGSFTVLVPPGPVTVELERGFEHLPVSKQLNVAPYQVAQVSLSSGRFIDMRALGWISGETHVHWVKNWWFENEDIDLLGMVQRAEDVRVVNNLALRHNWIAAGGPTTAANQAPMGPVPGHATGDYLIQMGEEYRNDPFYGHLNFLNLTVSPLVPVPVGAPAVYSPEGLVLPVSTGDLLGPQVEDYPTNADRIDWALRQQPPQSRPIIVSAHGLPRAVSADVVQGRIDSLDQLPIEDYYRVLDTGLRVPLTDGADHPVRRVGEHRCYVKVNGQPTYGAWIDGILAGATFVSSGPLVMLEVNGFDVGSEVQASPDDLVDVRLEIHSRNPIGRYQVVSNGEILLDRFDENTSTVAHLTLVADKSRWIVARCSAAPSPTFRPGTEPDAAHTSAVYLVVGGKDIYVDSGAAQELRDRCQLGGDAVWANGTFDPPNAAAKRAEARDWFYAGRDAYQAIIDAH